MRGFLFFCFIYCVSCKSEDSSNVNFNSNDRVSFYIILWFLKKDKHITVNVSIKSEFVKFTKYQIK